MLSKFPPTPDEARQILYEAVGCLPHFFMDATRVAIEKDLLTDEEAMRLWEQWEKKGEKVLSTTVGLIRPGNKISLTGETEPIQRLEMYAYLNRLRRPKLPPLPEGGS